MLSIPEYGWVNISIEDWEDRASYLTDPHLDLIDAFITLFNDKKITAVNFDAEGWEYKIVFDFYSVYIIDEKEDKPKLYRFDHSATMLAEELYKDISQNLYAWSVWDCVIEKEEDRIKNENIIKEKLEALKSAIDMFK